MNDQILFWIAIAGFALALIGVGVAFAVSNHPDRAKAAKVFFFLAALVLLVGLFYWTTTTSRSFAVRLAVDLVWMGLIIVGLHSGIRFADRGLLTDLQIPSSAFLSDSLWPRDKRSVSITAISVLAIIALANAIREPDATANLASAAVTVSWNMPWRWVFPALLIGFVTAWVMHILRERKRQPGVISAELDANHDRVRMIAEGDRSMVQNRVKLIGISYNPNFTKGYIDFTLAVHNDSIFDIVLQFSIKGDDLRFSPDWDRFHYELKMFTKEPVLCASRDGCFFKLRQPLTDGEMKQFQDDYDRVVGFSGLDITINGKDESDDVQCRPLKTDEYVYTKRGVWRVGDEMQALFVLARQKFEAVEALAQKPVDQPVPSPTEADVSVLVFGVTVEVEPDGLAPRVYSGFAGTTGQNKPLKSFAMWIDPQLTGLTMCYRGYFEDGTSSDFVDEGGIVERQGEDGRKLDVRGFCVKLAGADATKYDVVYSAHLQGTGDVERNYKNGEFCGTNDRAIEGMKVVVCKAGAKLPLLLA